MEDYYYNFSMVSGEYCVKKIGDFLLYDDGTPSETSRILARFWEESQAKKYINQLNKKNDNIKNN